MFLNKYKKLLSKILEIKNFINGIQRFVKLLNKILMAKKANNV